MFKTLPLAGLLADVLCAAAPRVSPDEADL